MKTLGIFRQLPGTHTFLIPYAVSTPRCILTFHSISLTFLHSCCNIVRCARLECKRSRYILRFFLVSCTQVCDSSCVLSKCCSCANPPLLLRANTHMKLRLWFVFRGGSSRVTISCGVLHCLDCA